MGNRNSQYQRKSCLPFRKVKWTFSLLSDTGAIQTTDNIHGMMGTETRMNFSLGSTGDSLTPARVHPPGATGLKLEFGSMGSTNAEKIIGTGRVNLVG